MVVTDHRDFRDVARLGLGTDCVPQLQRNSDCWQRTSFALLSVVVQRLLQHHRQRYRLIPFPQILSLTYVGRWIVLPLNLGGQENLNMFESELFQHLM